MVAKYSCNILDSVCKLCKFCSTYFSSKNFFCQHLEWMMCSCFLRLYCTVTAEGSLLFHVLEARFLLLLRLSRLESFTDSGFAETYISI